MTTQHARAGILELVLPTGGHVVVDFGTDGSVNPDVEATLVQEMLDATGTDENVCKALAAYAEASGMTARFFLGHESMIVEFGKA